jgi:hypothetical protein
MRKPFNGWWESTDWWIVAPIAIWMIAALAYGAFAIVRDKRSVSLLGFVRELGFVWKWSFVAAVVWLVVASVASWVATLPP